MLFWLLAALLTAAVVAFLLRPLLSPRVGAGPAHARARALSAILDALKRDENAGLLADAERDGARADIARALIAEVEGVPVTHEATQEKPPAPQPTTPRAPGLALLVAGFVSFGALGIYLSQGAPELAGPARVATARPPDLAGLVDMLKVKLSERPDDAEGQRFLGRGLSELGQYRDAAAAYARALELGASSAELYADYGEALVLAEGYVTEAAKRAFADALARDAKEPRARYYLALAKSEAGDIRSAYAEWLALLEDSPKDAPWRSVLARQIAAARQALGAEDAQETSTIPPAP
jgi:cytochrome c-type biogenesis protein CcmH